MTRAALAAATLLLAVVARATGPERSAEPPATPVPLRFEELVVGTSRGLDASPRARALAGRRVRLTGFMVKMELPPEGAFWLAPRPVECDEAGGGTADLPPEAVRVVVRSAAGRALAFIPRPLEVTGVLEVGPREEPEGTVSHLRLVLDPPAAAVVFPPAADDAVAAAPPRGPAGPSSTPAR